MFRTARPHAPATHRSTLITRATTVAAAALAVGAALTGCSVAVDGTPHAEPRPVAQSTPQTSQRATFPPRSDGYRTPRSPTPASPLPRGFGEDLIPHAAVLRTWMDDGWLPMPLLRQTDPDSGASAAMFGPAQTTSTDEGVPYFAAEGAPAGILTTFGAVASPSGNRLDGEETARRTAASFGGRLISNERLVVDGRAVVDSVIEVRSPNGNEMRQLIRRIDLPDHIVLIQSMGLRSDAQTVQEVQDIVTSTFTMR
jgi:hypothetical protein